MRRLALLAMAFLSFNLFGCGGGGGGIPLDNTPPVLSAVDLTREAGKLVVRAQATDSQSGIATVYVITPAVPQGVMMQAAGAGVYRAELPENTARVQVKATDRAGNESFSPEMRVPPPAPPF
ncbi:MAG: hypothetical protein KatS3mg023_1629 [Armatimonadota bacterium]|nr:MAG: hypothetical protein KatS3mg023_1629 [Armatimonadota bacterium]